MKNIVLLITALLMITSQVFGQTLRTMEIKNDTDRAILISFGYNTGQLQKFLVWVDRKSTLTVKKWDVDRPTNIFINDEFDPTINELISSQWLTGGERAEIGQYDYAGFMYVVPAGKTIDVKYSGLKSVKSIRDTEPVDYSVRLGLHSNSMFFKDEDILTKCTPDGKLKPVTECSKPEIAILHMNKEDPAKHTEEYELFEPRKGAKDLKDFQNFIEITLLRFEHGRN